MKNLKETILEKLVINKNSKKNYNVDELNNDNITLYNNQDCDDEDMQDMQWDYMTEIIKDIDANYDGFVVCRFNSLSKSKNLEKDVNDCSDDLQEISKRILTGKDLGYAVKVIGGHLEFDCINSGSKATYYVYALSPIAYEKIETYFGEPESLDGDDSDKLKFLFDEDSIISIEI